MALGSQSALVSESVFPLELESASQLGSESVFPLELESASRLGSELELVWVEYY